jgi:signal recognition particle subunit SRP54
MGDVLTLVERAQETLDEKQAEQMADKMRRNAFTLDDFLSQMQQIKKMGPIGGIIEMLPGMGGMAKQAQAAVDSGELKRVEAIIQSMTRQERNDPHVLNASRRRRIARGSGTTLQDVNRLIKQFGEMQKLMKQFAGGGGKRRGLPGLPFG